MPCTPLILHVVWWGVIFQASDLSLLVPGVPAQSSSCSAMVFNSHLGLGQLVTWDNYKVGMETYIPENG